MAEKEYSQLDKQRHTGAHVLAAAVKMYMDSKNAPVKFAIGPPIDNGFYYDFDFGEYKVTDKDLKEIEKKMRWLANKNIEMTGRTVSIDEAKKISADQPFKLELINDFAGQGSTEVSYYAFGNIFEDLCRGNHVDSTGQIGVYKIDKIAGAYWKGDEKNPQLTRIYVLMYSTQEELDNFLKMREEAEKRDHRKLGKELGLFVFSELVGPGMPLYTPRGFIVRNEIIKFSRELNERLGFSEVHTPNINKAELFKTSGHYDAYKEDMFAVKSNYTDEEYFLKPMNCPQHTQIYAAEGRSYRELPIRYSDFANLHRDEKPGQLSGLTRLRCFAQDDGHIFCREDQIEQEFVSVLGAVNEVLKVYGLDYHINLSTRDPEHKEKFLGSDEVWEKSESMMEKLLKDNNIKYGIGVGDAAFYGPKMDIIAHDAIGREFQISTIQLDMNMPSRFGLTYNDSDGKEKTPVLIHRALVGSPERFMGILIEHYGGNLPTWLAPVQVSILTINDQVAEFANKVVGELKAAGVRVYLDDRGESIGKKIREAEMEKVPYSLVIGEKEAADGKLAVRKRHEGDKGAVEVQEFIEMITAEIKNRK